MTKKTLLPRYAKNPFLEIYKIPVKNKKIAVLGGNDNVILNQNTGEISSTTLATFRKVDNEKFVKLFAQNVGLAFELNSYGIKAFTVLIWVVQNIAITRDLVRLNQYTLDSFTKDTGISFHITNFRKGLSELEKAKIIAKALEKSMYYINPHFVFNGDRIVYTQVVEKDKRTEEQKYIDEHQQDLF